MRINRAYVEAGTSGKQGLGQTAKIVKSEPRGRGAAPRQDGDILNLSPEALALLNNEDSPSLNSGPDDGLYDQSGNMTRQFDTVQQELRRLAVNLAASSKDGASKVNGLRSQLSSIQLQV